MPVVRDTCTVCGKTHHTTKKRCFIVRFTHPKNLWDDVVCGDCKEWTLAVFNRLICV